MTTTAFALVDCDAFYVSCERLFAASLRDRPVVVVGNNDGCVVARSKEAKALGIPMGAPLFQYQALVERYHVAVFSSNYALYQDLSDRVMACLASFTPRMEQYSIDEAWLDLGEIPVAQLDAYGRAIRERVLRDTGIPVSIGIASTKVLCKVACEAAKRQPAYGNVLNLFTLSTSQHDEVLKTLAVEDVWGIGKRWSIQLKKRGIANAYDLRAADHLWIRRHFPVPVERAVLELQGRCCLPLQLKPKARQSILVSRSFRAPTDAWSDLEEAVATYAANAAEKLRRNQQVAAHVNVFLQTNPFDLAAPQYAQSAEASLPFATAFPPDFLDLSHALLCLIYRPGYQFKRAGVLLTQLSRDFVTQADLFGLFSSEVQQQQRRITQVLDEINVQWGPQTLFYAAQGTNRAWSMKQTRRSPRYTTRWAEILSL